MRMNDSIGKQHVFGWVLAVAGSVIAAVALAGGSSIKDGVFTEEQAARGKLVYDKSCVNCHNADFYRDRLTRYENKPVEALFESVSTTMPQDNVGGLLTSEYLDVLAYIFSITGSPTGKTELTSDNMGAVNVVTK
jgi:S-disulfanyl-L-cysteine oxidoreductase SoxD